MKVRFHDKEFKDASKAELVAAEAWHEALSRIDPLNRHSKTPFKDLPLEQTMVCLVFAEEAALAAARIKELTKPAKEKA